MTIVCIILGIITLIVLIDTIIMGYKEMGKWK